MGDSAVAATHQSPLRILCRQSRLPGAATSRTVDSKSGEPGGRYEGMIAWEDDDGETLKGSLWLQPQVNPPLTTPHQAFPLRNSRVSLKVYLEVSHPLDGGFSDAPKPAGIAGRSPSGALMTDKPSGLVTRPQQRDQAPWAHHATLRALKALSETPSGSQGHCSWGHSTSPLGTGRAGLGFLWVDLRWVGQF